MQLRKQSWKLVRDVFPCQWCGKDHKTRECPERTKNGKVKVAQ